VLSKFQITKISRY